MKKKTLYLTTVLLLLSCAFALALEKEAALKNLKSVRLSIIPKDSPLTFQVRNMIELKLQQSGLKISEESPQELRLSILHFQDNPNINRYATLQLSLHEPVKLLRNPNMTITACTWEGATMVAYGPAEEMPSHMLEIPSQLIDLFLNDWMKQQNQ